MQKTANEQVEIAVPSEFAFDVKLELTAKGIRHTVHARGNDMAVVRTAAITQYLRTKQELEALGEVIAPVEIARSKE
jgi:hypothetical protein